MPLPALVGVSLSTLPFSYFNTVQSNHFGKIAGHPKTFTRGWNDVCNTTLDTTNNLEIKGVDVDKRIVSTSWFRVFRAYRRNRKVFKIDS